MSASAGTIWAAAGINVAVTILVGTIAFTTLQNQWGTARTLGEHTASLRTIGDNLQKLETDTAARDGAIQSEVTGLRRQILTTQTDVGAILAGVGIPIDTNIQWVSVNREIVGVPRDQEAADYFEASDFTPVQITPALGGYALDEASAQIVMETIDNAEATGAAESPMSGAAAAQRFQNNSSVRPLTQP